MARKNYNSAQKIVKAKKAFYIQFVIYLIVISFLFVVNMLTSREHFWFIYPMVGWGLAIVGQYSALFGSEKNKLYEKLLAEEREKEAMKEDEDDFDNEPEDELELKEFKELRKEWDDSDFV